MPELPEVETIRRDLAARITGCRIEEVIVRDRRVVRGMAPEDFRLRLKGKTIKQIARRGKALLLYFAEAPPILVVQLMMTGQLVYSPAAAAVAATGLPPAAFWRKQDAGGSAKVVFRLSNGGRLLYNDQRLFGRLQLVAHPEELKYFQTLGPEPFSRQFSPAWLKVRLDKRTASIKSVLMDARVVAGIGNIYASEILFAARIRPGRRAGTLTDEEGRALHRAVRRVLQKAVLKRGTSINTYRDGEGRPGLFSKCLQVYGREGKSCLRCGAPVKRIVISGRSSFYCGHCQQ